MVNETESYWSMRAKNEYLYKGEKLYTITAAPYYVKRREIIIKKLKNIYDGMEDKGKICICEQTAPYEFSGNGWKRRSFETYRDALEKQGFKCMIHETFRIDFGIHRKLFERHIAKKFLSEKSRIECNKNRVYLFLSRLCVFLSFKRLYHNKWGYIFITAEK